MSANWPPQGKSIFVCCTLNVDEFEDPKLVFEGLLIEGVRYIHAGREEGTHKHWQCYFEAPEQWRNSKWNRLVPRGSFRIAKGSAEQNINYQSKEDPEPYEFGKWRSTGPSRGKGKRTDLVAFKDAIKAGMTEMDLFDQHTAAMVMYPNAAKLIRSAFVPKRTQMPCIRWLYGPTRTGKTYQAVRVDGCTMVKGRFPFLIGYKAGITRIVFDEFRPEQHEIEEILTICDENTPDVEVKGCTIPMVAELIYFCTNKHPELAWPKADPLQKEAFLARIAQGGGEIRHCTTRKVPGQEGQQSIFEAFKLPDPSRGRSRSRSPSRTHSPDPPVETSISLSGMICPLCNLPYYGETCCMC